VVALQRAECCTAGTLDCAAYHRTSASESPVTYLLGDDTREAGSVSESRTSGGAVERQTLQVATTVFAVNNAEDLNKPSCKVILDTVRSMLQSCDVVLLLLGGSPTHYCPHFGDTLCELTRAQK
jgi:hypothetical protein